MESMNKFKVLTVMVICLFVFAIAAMYVNTKDVSQSKEESYGTENRNYDSSETRAGKEKMDFVDVMYALDNLETKVKDLEAKVDRKINSERTSKQNSDGMRCRIIGSRTASGIEPLSSEAAIQDARINGNDIVVTCSLR